MSKNITKGSLSESVIIILAQMGIVGRRELSTGTLIADIVLQLLSYVAQTEREFIRQRQAEGIAAAKARGVQFGRKPLEKPANYEVVKMLWQAGELSARAAAKELGVTHRTFLRWVTKNNG